MMPVTLHKQPANLGNFVKTAKIIGYNLLYGNILELFSGMKGKIITFVKI